ncbi:thioredoxin fold domain-containing protein [Chryseobacterium sp.]|uniref:thioredoxin fold domain-containing protein n=1 Tax=Chryseobacterium sp. TaxID=1871047 RepID=UPI0025C005A1|nr:thioredoxin fold domain-containing protein [Chryseobacterium sp.]
MFLMLVPCFCFSQKIETGTFSGLESSQGKRPVLIHFYTDWCTICKVESFHLNQDKELVELINDNFYVISFEAERTKEKIRFQENNFSYIPNGSSGVHEIVLALSRNKKQPVYPLWIILDAELNLIDYHEGLWGPEEMKTKLKELLGL